VYKNRFKNKKIFITGASRGIGKAIAQSFASQGGWVIGTRTRSSDVDDQFCNEWFDVDFSVKDQIISCAEYIRKSQPDILINNAGINKNAPFCAIDPEEFLIIQQVNVFAPFLLCQAAIPAMQAKKWGRIVNISSIWGKISMEHRAAYSASKFALDGMTLSLAVEHAVDGIIANCIAPGFIGTDLTHRMLSDDGIQSMISKVPLHRLGSVEEIANLVLWLSSQENTFVNGQNVAIDGGFTRV